MKYRETTTTYGLRMISYTGAKLWNDLPFQIYDISELDVQDFRSILKSWKCVDFEEPPYYV